MHKASKAAPRVVIYTHKDPPPLLRQLTGERIYRAEALEIYGVDRALLAELVARLDRRMVFNLAVSDRHVYVTLGDATMSGVITRYPLAAGSATSRLEVPSTGDAPRPSALRHSLRSAGANWCLVAFRAASA